MEAWNLSEYASYPLQKLELGLQEILGFEETAIQSIARHLLCTAGKRIRPALFFLSVGLWQKELVQHLPVALSIELIHTATLVHDDVVDEADLRRGSPTVNSLFGNSAAVLAGDWLFAKAFSLLTAYGEMYVIREMAQVVAEMSEGEIQQQAQRFNFAVDEKSYLERISKKTACFFSACCCSGGMVAGAREDEISALRSFGRKVGMAFQIIDDLLDFDGEELKTGKPGLGDLRQGVITLPVIHTLRYSPRRSELQKALPAAPGEAREALLHEISACGSLFYAREKAAAYIREALEDLCHLPSGPGRSALEHAASLVVSRRN